MGILGILGTPTARRIHRQFGFGNFWEFLGILGIFRKHIATDIVTTWNERNCLILLYITVGGLSLASEAAAGMNLPNARDGKARSVVR